MPLTHRTRRPLYALLTILLVLPPTLLAGPVARATIEADGVAIVATTEGDHLALREGPGFAYAVLATFAEGAEVAILGAPQRSPDGALWYPVAGAGLTGWSNGEFLLPVASNVLRVGGTEGDGARLRDAPGLAGGIVLVIPEGGPVVLTGPARQADGYEWAPVRYDLATGWIATIFLGGGRPAPGGATGGDPAPVGGAAPPPTVPPAPSLASGNRAEVVETEGLDLRIRSDSSRDAPISSHAPAGAVVLVVGGPQRDSIGDDWYVIDYDGVGGWVFGEYLERTDAPASRRSAGETSAPPPGAPPPAPPPGPPPLAAAPTPTTVPPTPPQMQPAAVTRSPNRPPAPTAITSPERGQAILAEALRHLGAPYVWGGDTPAGWDCSGLIVYVYKQVTGVTLPRTSQQQFLVGKVLAPNEIQPGDLVFFANTDGPGITHNGIALGDGRFVHARGEISGTVITSLADAYWSRHYAGARRP